MWFSFESSLAGSSEASHGGSSTFGSQTGSYTTTGDVTEAIVDELVIVDLAADVPGVEVTRLDAETIVVDYGAAGRFRLTVTQDG